MTVVLGIDAAWTPTEPSGVAVARHTAAGWRACGLAPSYAAFLRLADGHAVDWSGTAPAGEPPPVPALLAAAERLAGAAVTVVALDMPIARGPFSTRREADNAISRAFGSRACSTHSPTADRPGAMGRALTTDLEALGFTVATTAPRSGTKHALEVYPHTALLTLLGRARRVPYKSGNSTKYWPGLPATDRRALLLTELHQMHAALTAVLGPFVLPLPTPTSPGTLRALKRYEDALDALICAWVATAFLDGRATAYGDTFAAVWTPAAL